MRRLKTPEELRADLKLFEAAWKRESAKVMRNAVERMIAGGRRVPARYRMKLPRFTKTVLVPPPFAPGNPVLLADQPHRPSARSRKPSQNDNQSVGLRQPNIANCDDRSKMRWTACRRLATAVSSLRLVR